MPPVTRPILLEAMVPLPSLLCQRVTFSSVRFDASTLALTASLMASFDTFTFHVVVSVVVSVSLVTVVFVPSASWVFPTLILATFSERFVMSVALSLTPLSRAARFWPVV